MPLSPPQRINLKLAPCHNPPRSIVVRILILVFIQRLKEGEKRAIINKTRLLPANMGRSIQL